MSDHTHEDLLPSETIVKEAEKIIKPRANRKGEPSFFMNDDMRKLSTPWNIAKIRSSQINPDDLPAGVILDAAAGSGVQLIALTKGLRRPALGIEIEKEVAVLCAANMYVTSDKDDIQRTMDRVLIGDGTKAGEAMSMFWKSLRDSGTRAHPPIAMLHLDPARPRDAQNHHIEEMKPPLKELLYSWNEYLQIGPRACNFIGFVS